MYIDAEAQFCNAQAMTIDQNDSILSEKSIDLGAASTIPGVAAAQGAIINDVGRGESPEVLIQVVADMVGSGGSLQVQLVQADNAALSSNLAVLNETPAIPVASLVAGYTFRINRVPQGVSKRYLGLKFLATGANLTAGGKITAAAVFDRSTSRPTL